MVSSDTGMIASAIIAAGCDGEGHSTAHPRVTTDVTPSAQSYAMTGQDPAARYMIDSVQTPPGGCIGLTPCPGSARFPSARESWQRDLGADFDVIAEWGASAVVSLVQAAELKSPALDDLGPTPG